MKAFQFKANCPLENRVGEEWSQLNKLEQGPCSGAKVLPVWFWGEGGGGGAGVTTLWVVNSEHTHRHD